MLEIYARDGLEYVTNTSTARCEASYAGAAPIEEGGGKQTSSNDDVDLIKPLGHLVVKSTHDSVEFLGTGLVDEKEEEG